MKWQNEKRVRIVPTDVGEDTVEIRPRDPIDRSQRDTQSLREGLHLPIAELLRRIGRVPDDSDPGQGGHRFLEHLQRLLGDR
jgi:hypothetical protein